MLNYVHWYDAYWYLVSNKMHIYSKNDGLGCWSMGYQGGQGNGYMFTIRINGRSVKDVTHVRVKAIKINKGTYDGSPQKCYTTSTEKLAEAPMNLYPEENAINKTWNWWDFKGNSDNNTQTYKRVRATKAIKMNMKVGQDGRYAHLSSTEKNSQYIRIQSSIGCYYIGPNTSNSWPKNIKSDGFCNTMYVREGNKDETT